ncbi:MAG: hypothetical protein ACRD1A_12120 [Terriglobales bacterium]
MNIFALAALWLFCSSAVAPRQQAPPAITMRISVASANITSGDRVRLQVEFKNVSSAPADAINPGNLTLGYYAVRVTNPSGLPAARTAYGRVRPFAYNSGSLELARLAPGQTLRAEIALSSLVDLTLPGKYYIQAFSRRSNPRLASNRLVITVVAPQ